MAAQSIQERRQGALRVCEVPRCGHYTQDALTPYCTTHRSRLYLHGSVHARHIKLTETNPWGAELRRTLRQLYKTPTALRTSLEHQVAQGITKAVLHVEGWLKEASGCYPCVAREDMARLAGAGISAKEIVMRFLTITHYSRHALKVLNTAPEIRQAVGRAILKRTPAQILRDSKRMRDLPLASARDIGASMLDHHARVAFQVSMLADEGRAERMKHAEANAQANTPN